MGAEVESAVGSSVLNEDKTTETAKRERERQAFVRHLNECLHRVRLRWGRDEARRLHRAIQNATNMEEQASLINRALEIGTVPKVALEARPRHKAGAFTRALEDVIRERRRRTTTVPIEIAVKESEK